MKKLASTAMIVALITPMLSGCEIMLLGGAAAATYEVMKDDRSASEVATDARIVAAIKQKLLRDKDIAGWDINVDSFRTEVTLHGNVPNGQEKERVILLASSVKGVSKIVSELVIVPPGN